MKKILQIIPYSKPLYSRFLSLILSALFFLFFAEGIFAQKKLNVIFINLDDLSIAFSTYGNPYAPTPNIERLAQHGVMFSNVYAQYSLCSPSRTSAFSGTRVQTTKITDNNYPIRFGLGDGFRFLPEYFHDNGYRTECYGKFMCAHDSEVSWDKYFNAEIDDGGFRFKDDNENNSPLATGPQVPVWYIDTVNKILYGTEDGIETLKFSAAVKRPAAYPYFYNLGLQTHNPFTPMLQFWNKTGYAGTQEQLQIDPFGTKTNVYGNSSINIPLPDSPPDDTADVPPVALKDLLHYPDAELRRIRHGYYAEIIQVDSIIGNLLDQFDAQNIWDSSVVVFWSDHGLSMGEHDSMWLKIDMFEECLSIPRIICAPGRKKGVICNQLVEAVDLFQTLTELCGIPTPEGKEGSGLVPLLDNPNIPWKKAIFSNLKRNLNGDTLLATAVQTELWHYNNWQEGGEELYNIVSDPTEITNLALNPVYTDTVNKLRSILATGWQGVLPPVYTGTTYFKDADGDGFGKTADSLFAYFKPDGYVLKQGDCNDKNKKIYPGAAQNVCNSIDDNCNMQVDENRPKPTITANGSLDICAAGKVTLSTNSGAGFMYQWKFNGSDIPGATKRTLIANMPGIYKVGVTAANGCGNISDSTTVISSCLIPNDNIITYIQHAAIENLSVFPNPSTGNISINFINNIPEKIGLKILNANGQVVY